MTERSTSRAVVKGSMLGAGVLLAIALTALVNIVGWKYYERFDWTSSKLYSLSEKSLNVLAGLDRDIEATVMLGPGSDAYSDARELLERYQSRSPRLTVRVVDPEKNLAEAQQLVDKYELSQLDVVVFESGEERRIVQASDLVEYDYSAMQFGGQPQATGFKGEQLFTGAIIELMESRKPRVLFTTGHGEAGMNDFSARGMSDLRELLGQDNFELEEWASLGQPAVPEGTDLIVIAGPRSGFVEPEVEVLRRYLLAGGRLLLMVDPTLSQFGGLEPTGLDLLLAEYDIELGQDIIVDPANPIPFFGPDTIFVGDFRDHDVTRSLRQANLQVILPLARSVRRLGDAEGGEAVELFTTSSEGWGETDMENLTAVARGEGDLEGPVPLAVAVQVELPAAETAAAEAPAAEVGGAGEGAESETAAEVEAEATRETRLIVVGDSDFASNSQIRQTSNAVLVANALNWLVERDALVGIPPKTPEQTKLTLTSSQLSTITWLIMVIMPGLAIAAGVAVHLRRRR
jgi:ABC-type uncharacterized transport system involved in gliding motility auxiliary subunit